MRKTNEELEQIKKDLGVSKLWSWSRVNSYMTDPYSYMLKYILKIPEDRNDSIYGISGNMCHSILEEFYKGNLNHQEMLEKYEEQLFEFNVMGLLYDRSDKDKNEKIAKKYEDCIRHFFLNHKKATDKPIIEPFILIKIGDEYFQGYVDFLHVEKRDGKNKIIITDWKTSSLYTGKKLLENSGQLLLYAEGIHQKTSKPYEDIIIRFNFLKYVDVICDQKKGDKKVRQIERNSIGEKLKSNAKTWLKHYKHSEDEMEGYLEEMVDTNGIDCLPEEVRERFQINDCYVEVELSEEVISKHKEYIINIIEEINSKEELFSKTKDKNIFWREITRENSYFHANLSGYSANIHEPYREYLKELDLQNGIKPVSGGSSSSDSDSGNLDWLDEIL